MISWPTTLPQCPHQEYELTPASGLSSPEDQQSPVRTRTYPEHDGVFHFRSLSVAQQQALRTFYDVTLNQTSPWSAPWLPFVGLTHHFCLFDADKAIQWQGRRGGKADATLAILIVAGVPVDAGGNITYGAE